MEGVLAALKLLEAALDIGEGIVGAIMEKDEADLRERIEKARAAIKDPIDTSAADSARRAELERVLKGNRGPS